MVGHGNDLNPLVVDSVDEAERETGEYDAPCAVQMDRPALRGRERALDHKAHLVDKGLRGNEATLCVPVLGIEKLPLCSGVKLDFRIHGDD